MSDFDGRQLAVGVARGVRSFDVDEFGRLTGVNYPAPWRPGENKATCYLGSYDPYRAQLAAMSRATTLGRTLPSTQMVLKPAKGGTNHSLAKCTCGFYAFYDGSDDYRSDARISAVVEGYGEVLIGTRGFRSGKARIVAICIPGSKDRVRRRLKVWGLIGAKGAVGGCAGETGLQSVLYYIAGNPILGSWLALLTAGAFWTTFFMPIQWPTRSLSKAPKVPAKLVALIRRNYADVPVFDRFEDMIRAFPPDKGLTPSPETDPDFWEANA